MRAILTLISGLIGFVALTGTALAQQTRQPPYWGHGHPMWDGHYGWFMGPIMMIIVFAIIITIVVLLVRWLSGSGRAAPSPAPGGKSPTDILKERFAKGEIDKKEFEERKKVLEG